MTAYGWMLANGHGALPIKMQPVIFGARQKNEAMRRLPNF